MKKKIYKYNVVMVLVLCTCLFACTNKKDKIIDNLKLRITQDSFSIKEKDNDYRNLYYENISLTGDTIQLHFVIDSLEYVYTRKHNNYYKYLLFSQRAHLIGMYQDKIDKLQTEMDSMAAIN